MSTAQRVASPATAVVTGPQPGSSCGTSVCLLRSAAQARDRGHRQGVHLVLAVRATFSFTLDNPIYEQVTKNVVKEIGIRSFLY